MLTFNEYNLRIRDCGADIHMADQGLAFEIIKTIQRKRREREISNQRYEITNINNHPSKYI